MLQVQVENGSLDNPNHQPLGSFPAEQLHKQTDGALAFKREARNLGKSSPISGLHRVLAECMSKPCMVQTLSC